LDFHLLKNKEMAKESMKARERKRERMVARYEKKRAALTKVLKSTSTDEAVVNSKWEAMMALQKLPANSSKVRLHNRCGLTGRPRGYMRQFGISRVTFREMALAGKIPGVRKASW
jgi:small subunit ribosomal protein S14